MTWRKLLCRRRCACGRLDDRGCGLGHVRGAVPRTVRGIVRVGRAGACCDHEHPRHRDCEGKPPPPAPGASSGSAPHVGTARAKRRSRAGMAFRAGACVARAHGHTVTVTRGRSEALVAMELSVVDMSCTSAMSRSHRGPWTRRGSGPMFVMPERRATRRPAPWPGGSERAGWRRWHQPAPVPTTRS